MPLPGLRYSLILYSFPCVAFVTSDLPIATLESMLQ